MLVTYPASLGRCLCVLGSFQRKIGIFSTVNPRDSIKPWTYPDRSMVKPFYDAHPP